MMALNVLLGLAAFVLGFRAVDHRKDAGVIARLTVATMTIGAAFWGLYLAFVEKEPGWGLLASSAGFGVGLMLFILSFSRPVPVPQQSRGIK
jgi:hypothetical protein